MELVLLKSLLLFVIAAQSAYGYVFSCDEVKYKLLNTVMEFNTTYMCVFTQEGFSNWNQLKSIKFNNNAISLYDIRNICYTQSNVNDAWRLTADASLKLNCNQEFTILFTSATAFREDYVLPLKKENSYSVQSSTNQPSSRTLVTPQAKMWINTQSCTGEGSITFSTGAGIGESEQRFVLRTWTCATIPRVIYSFDDVVTLTVDAGVVYNFSTSSEMGSSSRPPIAKVKKGDYLAVLTSGYSNDLQNLKGNTDSRAYINIDRKEDVTVVVDVTLDPVNTGSVQLQKRKYGSTTKYTTGTRKTETFNTDYLEVRYEPSALQSQTIWRSLDNVLIDVYIGTKTAPTTTSTTTRTTTTTTTTTITAQPTTPTSTRCGLCSRDLVSITIDGGGSHAFESDEIELTDGCAVRTMVCTGANANIELNDGTGVVTDGPDGVARLVLECNHDGTAWLDEGFAITQVECASG